MTRHPGGGGLHHPARVAVNRMIAILSFVLLIACGVGAVYYGGGDTDEPDYPFD